MPLHRRLERDTRYVKTDNLWDWLSKGDLKRETESLLAAAQDQALNKNFVRKYIYHQVESDMCGLCGAKVENVIHIISACKMLAQKDYEWHHGKVCRHLHWCLSKKYGLDADNKWYYHRPEKVVENDVVKILWDFNIQTDHIIEHHRPDVTVIDKTSRKCLIVDVVMPGD